MYRSQTQIVDELENYIDKTKILVGLIKKIKAPRIPSIAVFFRLILSINLIVV